MVLSKIPEPVKKLLRPLRPYTKFIVALMIVGAFAAWAPTVYANLSSRGERYDLNKTNVNDIPKHKVAIVFGAGINLDGTPTPYLRWRVETAVKLYKAGRVEKLLMTGDNSTSHHNEPVGMRNLAEALGVPPGDIVLDYAGFNTYDSCYRAHKIFGLNDAILVSQGYHLPRAIMVCNGAGVQSIGVSATHSQRTWTVSYLMREWLSTDKSVYQLVFKPTPTVLGQPEPIKYLKQ